MTLPFTYYPIYGVEPFENVTNADLETGFGGGAKITGNNLLVTLWNSTGTDADGRATSNELMQPLHAYIEGTGTYDPPFGNAASNSSAVLPFANSRTAVKFYVDILDAEVFEEAALICVLNPQGELKNFYINGALRALAIIGGLGFEYFTKVTILDGLVWDARVTDELNKPLTGFFSVFGSVGAGPLMQTGGENGVFPLYYPSLQETAVDASLVPAFIAGLREISKGNFFVPVVLSLDLDELTFITTFTWPHSISR